MPELYIFSQDDELLTIITEDTGLVSAPVRIEVNSVPDTPFSFTVEADSDNAQYVKEENKAVYRDHEGDLRLVVIREIDDEDSIDGPLTTAICEPEFMELVENIIVDRRFVEKEAQEALDGALEGTRYTGEVEVELGRATTNFYYINSVEAIWRILDVWGGEFKDVVEFDEENNIIARKVKLIQRLGADLGQRFEIDHNINEIGRTVLSYPLTAMYGRGASLPIEDDEGEHTGGYTRYIDFADVEWKISNGDPVDKPLGQRWVGDPEALQEYGRMYDGHLQHRYGIFHNQDYEEPEELLWATWQNLQQNKHPVVNYRLSVDLFDDKVSLGDTAIANDRYFARPIKIQARIMAMEYDLLDIENTTVVEMGQLLDLEDDRLDEIEREVAQLRNRRPSNRVTEDSYPDIKPGTPVNVEAIGGFEVIQLYWDYVDEIYIKHYEVFGSQVADFVPDSQHLLYRGQVSAFAHKVETNETWYYYVKAVNYHGTESDLSEIASASTARINLGLLDNDVKAELNEARNNASEAVDKANLATSNANEALQEAQTAFDEAQNALGTASNALDVADDALTTAQSAIDTASNAASVAESANELAELLQTTVNGHTTAISNIENELSLKMNTVDADNKYATQLQLTATSSSLSSQITSVQGDVDNLQTNFSSLSQTVSSLTTRIGDAEGNITALQQTSSSLAGRLTDAEGNITTLTATVNGLQTTVSDVQGNVSNLTQLSNTLQARLSDAEGNINTLTLTSQSMQSTITSVRDDLDSLEIDGRNLFVTHNLEEMVYVNEQNNALLSWKYHGEPNTQYTLSTNIPARNTVYDLFFGVYPVEPSSYLNGVALDRPRTITSDDTGVIEVPIRNMNLVNNIVNGTYWVKLEKGSKATNWSPAPEDMATQSQITQLSDAINLRVQKGDVINQINISTEDILIDGRRTWITNQTIIDEGVIRTAHIEDGSITNAKIASLSADKINAGAIRGIDIYGSRFRSSTGSDFMEITGGNVHLEQNSGRYVNINPDGIYGHNPNGSYRFRADSLLVTSRAFGTTTSNVYLSAQSGYEARVVRIDEIPSDGEIGSYAYLNLRANQFFGNVLEVNAGVPGNNLYLRPRAGGEVRITGANTTDAYYPLRAGAIYSNNYVSTTTSLWMGTDNAMHVVNKGFVENSSGSPIYRDIFANDIWNRALITRTTNAYVGTDNELRVVNKGLSNIYRAVRAERYFSTSGTFESAGTNLTLFNTNTSGRVYLQSHIEVRATKPGSPSSYIPVLASDFVPSSSEQWKTDIAKYEGSALNLFRQSVIYQYHKHDSTDIEYGFITERETPSVIKRGDGISIYSLLGLSVKATQELDEKIDLTREELVMKIAKLEERLNKLEVA